MRELDPHGAGSVAALLWQYCVPRTSALPQPVWGRDNYDGPNGGTLA